jgi:hypothetical protein
MLYRRGMLVRQLGVGHLDFVEFSLSLVLFRLQNVEGLCESLFLVRRFFLRQQQLLDLSFKGPVLILVSVLALIKYFESLLEALGVNLEPRFFGLGIFQLFIFLCEQRLQIPDLCNERSANLGGEFDVMDSVGWLVS